MTTDTVDIEFDANGKLDLSRWHTWRLQIIAVRAIEELDARGELENTMKDIHVEDTDQRSINRSLRERVAELEDRVGRLELGLKALADGAGDPINRRYRKMEEHA